MKGRFLLDLNKAPIEGNIYADKSAIVLDWLLRIGIERKHFSLREVAKDSKVSIGLVQRIFGALAQSALIQTTGIRTAKQFSIKKPKILLNAWLEHYSIVKKCKMWTYRSGFQNREEILKALKESKLKSKTALALHSAAEAHGCKNTNLSTLELYMLEPNIRESFEEILALEPQERGYEVLLIEPYYKSLLKLGMDVHEEIKVSSPLLTFLDLYHFPLRGIEQGEFMAARIPELKRIYNP